MPIQVGSARKKDGQYRSKVTLDPEDYALFVSF